MKLSALSVILCSLLLCACISDIGDNGNDRDNDGTLLVNLDISVALSDVSDALTRAPGDAGAANDNEKMHTLRVVIVRPDLTVEANRLIDLRAAAALQYKAESFRVAPNERKRIYLFVNENTTATDRLTGKRKLVDFDFDGIKVGSPFPADVINGLKISLNDNTEQIDGPLPMSEQHECFVNKKPVQECSLFVTRAAVKFTFHIKNESGNSVTLNNLTISRMAREEWYMPRAKYGDPDETTGQRVITEYEVPPGVGYYEYGKDNPVPDGVTVASGGEAVLDPIYLLEGKYTDEPDSEGRNYSLEISLNNTTRRHYFPELETLPRNTHVVVNITCDADSEVTCGIDVIPYSDVPLDPGFGL